MTTIHPMILRQTQLRVLVDMNKTYALRAFRHGKWALAARFAVEAFRKAEEAKDVGKRLTTP